MVVVVVVKGEGVDIPIRLVLVYSVGQHYLDIEVVGSEAFSDPNLREPIDRTYVCI